MSYTLFMIRTDNAATDDITEKGSQNFQRESILQLFFSYQRIASYHSLASVLLTWNEEVNKTGSFRRI